MSGKKYGEASDNLGVRENLERIRQSMVAYVARAHATPDAGGDSATLVLERQNFAGPERNLNAAVSSCREIAEAHAEEDQGQGFGGWLSRAVRSCLRWYISPEERYWQTMTDGLGHVVASLKAHEAVLHAHGETVRSTQGECRELVSQLQEVGPGTTAKS